MKRRGTVLAWAVAGTLLVLLCVGLWWALRRPPAPKAFLESVPPSALPSFQETPKIPEAASALTASLDYLARVEPSKTWDVAGVQVHVGQIRAALAEFQRLVGLGLSEEDFEKAIRERFVLYRVRSAGEEPAGGPVLMTGYFQPVLQASGERSAQFSYPLYAVPPDLIKVTLSDFDAALPKRTLWGRVSGQALVPYYTRRAIDEGQMLKGAPVLAWLPSMVDGLMLHIQGSGILLFPDGSRHYIHYAGSNGLPYGSIGKWLIDHGDLSPGKADWPTIAHWAALHPNRFNEALEANPRYIFFRWEETGPIGALGRVLTPYRSVALDPRLFPPGALLFMKTVLPGESGGAGRPFSAFVFNQDVGAAIQGLQRVDLYCGEGDEAGKIAGRLKSRGDLYMLLLKGS